MAACHWNEFLTMRIARGPRLAALSVALSVLLSGCLAPALLLPSPAQLMWALLKPLVGLDPNVVHLYDQPLIRDRMTALLGPNYDTALQLLKTADQLQQQGPLFFVVSKFTPIPEVAEKAGLVWNSDTNQMAVAILKGDGVQVFSEAVQRKATDEANAAVTSVVPVWPAVMQAWAQQP